MADREKILRYFKAGGDEELAAKLLDLAEGARKSKKFRITDFLDPHNYNVAEIVAANYENIKIEADGGFNCRKSKSGIYRRKLYGRTRLRHQLL